nr:reverse transcriptase domain-containing protein [Tanacetum cinerariifolium]
MEELCQPSLNGRGGPIAPILIQAMNFGLKNDMIQQVKDSCHFHGLPGDDANKHLDKFLHVTQSIKLNGVTDDALRLYIFPHSLTHHATAWFDRVPRNLINTFEQMAKMFLRKYFPPSMVTKLRNEITNFHQRPDESLFEVWERYNLSIDRCPNHNMLLVKQIDTFYNGLTLRHHHTINAVAGGTFMKRPPEECYDLIENMTAHHNDWDTSAQRSESSSSINSSSDMKIAASKAEMALQTMKLVVVLIPFLIVQPPLEILKMFMLQEPTKGANQVQNQPPAYQAPAYQALVYQALTNMTSLTNLNLELKNMFGQFMKMSTVSSLGSGTLPGNTITNPKEDLKGITTRRGTTYPGPTIPTTSSSPVVERKTEATKDTMHPTNNESTEDVQPSVVLTESLILNSEPVNSLIIESVPSLVSASRPNQRPSITYPSRLQDQKLLDKANDQRDKFFQIIKDLNFNISFADGLILMPKFGPSIKSLLTNKDKLCELARSPLNEHFLVVLLKKLPEKLGDPGKFLIPCDFPGMAECLALADLELVDRLISRPVGVVEDVFVKVVFDADPRVPLILGRSFLKTKKALIDVLEGELTLRVGKEAITFNLDQTSRYSKVLGFSDMVTSGSPTPYYDLIVSTTSLTLTSFGNNDFLLEEVDAFLALEDDPTSPKVDQSYVNTKGDILLLEAFLNDDPSLPLQIKEIICLKFVRNLKSVKLNLTNLQLMNIQRLNSKTYLPISNTYFWNVTKSFQSLLRKV